MNIFLGVVMVVVLNASLFSAIIAGVYFLNKYQDSRQKAKNL